MISASLEIKHSTIIPATSTPAKIGVTFKAIRAMRSNNRPLLVTAIEEYPGIRTSGIAGDLLAHQRNIRVLLDHVVSLVEHQAQLDLAVLLGLQRPPASLAA